MGMAVKGPGKGTVQLWQEAVPEGMQHNIFHLQIVQEVLAQLSYREPLLLTLPCQLLQRQRQWKHL